MKNKVLAYITREDRTQLLVFRHVHHPEAGLQVPGGTVEESEALEVALHREIEEESGLTGLRMVAHIATERFYSDFMHEWQERHFFHLQASHQLPNQWLHIVSGGGEDEALHFLFSWLSPAEAADALSGGQGRWIKTLLGE